MQIQALEKQIIKDKFQIQLGLDIQKINLLLENYSIDSLSQKLLK
jgi:hypothetical protein